MPVTASATLDNTPSLGSSINKNATSYLQSTPKRHTCTARDTRSLLLKVSQHFIDGAGCEPIKAALKTGYRPREDDTPEFWIGGVVTPPYDGLLNKAFAEIYHMVDFDGFCPNCDNVVPSATGHEISEDSYDWKQQVC
ncbi:hypothetical protein AC578_10924 [Pseudocercospora eumusae]|uniref:Uncharacterized protein n=1 Tax=Pseudocercospora eumusae TaxID=321146 RepID=A0A139GVM5_9PEZI|nr:hypothetical protein AC578_10924 [Pseudocercospora eumusae]